MQYFCKETNQKLNEKRQIALATGFVGIMCCLILYLMLQYVGVSFRFDYKLWDIETVTAADFTVEW